MPNFRLHMQDWLAFMLSIPDESVDLIITDPPYISIDRHRYGTNQRLKKWFPTIENSAYSEMFFHFNRVLRDNRHVYFFCDEETQTHVKQLMFTKEDDFYITDELRFWKSIIWDKKQRGMGYHYATSHELIMFFEKGKRALNDLSHKSILSDFPALRGDSASWPTEKPVGLAQLLIGNSTMAGMTVLDPFMGSGAFGEAALKSGCNFIGNDLLGEAVDIAHRRLDAVQLSLLSK